MHRRPACVAALALACAGDPAAPPPWTDTAQGPVGSEACAACHPAQAAAWRGSHHAAALVPATPEAVPGLTAPVGVPIGGEVLTAGWGPAGATLSVDGRDLPAPWRIGVAPLQQLLVRRADGALHAPTVAWDSRPAGSGGQRWFALPTDGPAPRGDALHWDGPAYNADHMCLECHTTGFRKGFQAGTGTWASAWDEAGVGCEACHGPGARHAAWARAGAPAGASGLEVVMGGHPAEAWVPDASTGIARSPGPAPTAEVDVCARCHSRRATLVEPALAGAPLLDTHRPSLLEEGLYTPDGRILDEVFEWGSFTQSRMHAAGVVCSDCHDPHAAGADAPGPATCATCHAPARFDAAAHHRHGGAATCVDCHLPARTYMGVDVRHDHAFKVPRPVRDAALGLAGPCTTACHADRDAAWAAAAAGAWGWTGPWWDDAWVTAMTRGQAGAEGARERLAAVVGDGDLPPVVRGSAARLLGVLGDVRAAGAATDTAPLVRLGAVDGLVAGSETASALAGRLTDLRAIRYGAALSLVAAPPEAIGAVATRLDAVLAEVAVGARRDADREDALRRLAAIALRRGDLPGARAALADATRRAPWSLPAWAERADLERAVGDDAAALRLLDEGLRAAPGPALRHARGLTLVRLRRLDEALLDLRAAAEAAPDEARFAYVLAVALSETGDREGARAVLGAAVTRHPDDPDLRALRDALR